VVRVEGDGSFVIAGKAAPNAKVEIVTGARVIGRTIAGPDGDFAIVADEPLSPADTSSRFAQPRRTMSS
jgi:hypothetical protein